MSVAFSAAYNFGFSFLILATADFVAAKAHRNFPFGLTRVKRLRHTVPPAAARGRDAKDIIFPR